MRGNRAFVPVFFRLEHFNSCLYMRGNIQTWHTMHLCTYFNSCLYMRGNDRKLKRSWRRNISIHASTWEATDMMFTAFPQTEYFNSCLYMRGNGPERRRNLRGLYFNSRLYMRGNRTQRKTRTFRKNFNSRLYMRGNIKPQQEKRKLHLISIHASTWEATKNGVAGRGRSRISIHASTWEATVALVSGLIQAIPFQFTPLHERQPWSRSQPERPKKYFNSRLYMRGNIEDYAFTITTRQISIHASTWEATEAEEEKRLCRVWFQFTPLHERQLDTPIR